MASVLEEFVVSLGLDTKKFDTKKAENQIKSFAGTVVKAFAAIQAVKLAGSVIDQTTAAADELAKFSRDINANMKDVDAWGQAAVRAGGSAEGLRNSLKGIRNAMSQEAILKGDHIFARLGIGIRDASGALKDPTKILSRLNKSFQHLDEARAVDFARKLGIDDKTYRLLRQTPDQLNKTLKRMKSLSTVNVKFAKDSERFRDNLADFRQVQQKIAAGVVSFLLPALNKIIEFFVEMGIKASENFGKVKKIIGTVIRSITALALAAGIVLLPAIIQMGIALAGSFLGAIPAIAAAGAALLAALMPILPIVLAISAAVAGLAFIIEDLIVGFKGGESVIFDLAKTFKTKFANVIAKALVHIKKLINNIKTAVQNLKSAFASGMNNAVKTVKPFLDAVKDIASKAKDIFAGAFSGLRSVFDNIAQAVNAKLEPLVNIAKGLLNNKFVQSAVQLLPGSKNPNSSKNTTINQNNRVDSINISVGSGDPDTIAQALENGKGLNFGMTAAQAAIGSN